MRSLGVSSDMRRDFIPKTQKRKIKLNAGTRSIASGTLSRNPGSQLKITHAPPAHQTRARDKTVNQVRMIEAKRHSETGGRFLISRIHSAIERFFSDIHFGVDDKELCETLNLL
jgi:hypothetical protein